MVSKDDAELGRTPAYRAISSVTAVILLPNSELRIPRLSLMATGGAAPPDSSAARLPSALPLYGPLSSIRVTC